jgi:hypothetical protein
LTSLVSHNTLVSLRYENFVMTISIDSKPAQKISPKTALPISGVNLVLWSFLNFFRSSFAIWVCVTRRVRISVLSRLIIRSGKRVRQPVLSFFRGDKSHSFRHVFFYIYRNTFKRA